MRWQGAINAPFNQVVIRSIDSVRIVARVAMPEQAADVRGVVVACHGYADVPDGFTEEAEPWCERGLAVVRVRVRGYPPSTFDAPDLRGDWILHNPPHGIQNASAWIVRGAAADFIQAIRCARAYFGEATPLVLHGESLGGGLAVIAAAQLTRMNAAPQRLILALPSLGDWRWRAPRYCNGAGGRMNVLLDALRGKDRAALIDGLLLHDAALHARHIAAPTLAKLALRDDVVPAPSASAIFNALASPRKWRFLTRFGHFDGGLADARRHAAFERLHVMFADPSHAPEQAIAGAPVPLDLPNPPGKSP